MQSQRVAANQAAQVVAERAQILHNEAIAQFEGQAHDVVQATFQEALATVEQLRHELIDLGRLFEQQLKECRTELTKAEAESNAVRFQLSQSKIEVQVKDREIQRLRQAAPSATDAVSPPEPVEVV